MIDLFCVSSRLTRKPVEGTNFMLTGQVDINVVTNAQYSAYQFVLESNQGQVIIESVMPGSLSKLKSNYNE